MSSHRSWKAHHVGIATTAPLRLIDRLTRVGFDVEQQFSDPLQGVDGSFVTAGDLRLEILSPSDGSSTLEPWLTSGNRLYQVAVEVDNLEREIESIRAAGGVLVREPLESVAFGGRRIAFLMIGTGFLLELIEGN